MNSETQPKRRCLSMSHRMLGEQFVGSHFTWGQIEARHPSYAEENLGADIESGEEGYSMDNTLYRTVHDTVHATADDPDADNSWDEDISFTGEQIPVKNLTYTDAYGHSGLQTSDTRVESAMRGRWGTGVGGMPPILVVRRGGQNIVADGNHRVTAARERGIREVPAYVAESDKGPLPKRDW